MLEFNVCVELGTTKCVRELEDVGVTDESVANVVRLGPVDEGYIGAEDSRVVLYATSWLGLRCKDELDRDGDRDDQDCDEVN